MAKLTHDQIALALKDIHKSVQEHKEALVEIRLDQRVAYERWQAFMGIFFTLTA